MTGEVHLLHVFPSFGFGGMEVRMTRVMKALGPAFRHTIVSLSGNTEAAILLADSEVAFDVRTGPAKASPPSFIRSLRHIIEVVNAPTVVTYNWGALEAGIAAKFLSGRRWIHNECGLGMEESARPIPRRVWTSRLILPFADLTIAVSSNLFELARSVYRVPAGRLRLIQNGVDLNRFRPTDCQADARKSLNVSPQGLLVGFVGMFRAEKRPDFAIRAFASVSFDSTPPHLIMAGDGPLKESLVRLAQDLGVADRVHFTGQIGDVTTVYSALDCYILTSANEGAPNSLLEAMACGLPSIATPVGSCPHILGPSNPGLSPTGSVQDLTGVLQSFLQAKSLRETLGVSNRTRVETSFSSTSMIEQYREAFTG